ncbi:hypothetical protein PMAYCL1PPCAC_31494, partial [Pristionchus mayeri]
RFFLRAYILCWDNKEKQGPMFRTCEDTVLQKRCQKPRDDNGFKWATFYHSFEHDPAGKKEVGKGEKWYNLGCTLGFKESRVTLGGLSCTGGLKDGRCSEE